MAGLRAGPRHAGLRPDQEKRSTQAATSKASRPASFRFTTGATSSDGNWHDDHSGSGLGGDDAPEDVGEDEEEEGWWLTTGTGDGRRLDGLDLHQLGPFSRSTM